MPDVTASGVEHTAGPGLAQAVRRSPMIVLALLLVGLVLGALVTLARGETYTAQAQMLVGANADVAVYSSGASTLQPQARSQAAAVSMRTDMVTDAASALLNGKVTGRQIRAETVVAPVTDSAVVTISATTSSAQRSADIANALAKAYDERGAQLAQGTGSRTQQVLLAQRAALGKEIDSLQAAQAKRLAAVAAPFASEDTELKQRLTRLALSTDVKFQGYSRRLDNLSDTMTTLRSSQAENQVDTQLVTGGTNTVYSAKAPASKLTTTLIRNVLIGGVLGLLLGLVVAWRRLDRIELAAATRPTHRESAPDEAETGPLSFQESSSS